MNHVTDRTFSSAQRGILVAVGLGLALLAAACGGFASQGSGEALVEQLELDVSNVDSVAASDIWEVEVKVGEVPGVEIRIDDNLRDRIDVKVNGDQLELGLRNGIVNAKVGFNAVVTLTSVAGLSASDSSEVVASGLTTDQLLVSGSDSAKITLAGSAGATEVEAADASKVDLRDLQVVDATVQVTDAAHLDVSATGTVKGKATDAADVTVTGGASLDVSTSDAASISGS